MSPSHSERRDTGGLNIIPNVVIGIRHIIPPKLSTKFLSTKFQGPPPPHPQRPSSEHGSLMCFTSQIHHEFDESEERKKEPRELCMLHERLVGWGE